MVNAVGVVGENRKVFSGGLYAYELMGDLCGGRVARRVAVGRDEQHPFNRRVILYKRLNRVYVGAGFGYRDAD